MTDQGSTPPPVALRIVRGLPDGAELAALVAVVSASGEAEPAAIAVGSAWADPVRRMRSTPTPGPGQWRRSAFSGNR